MTFARGLCEQEKHLATPLSLPSSLIISSGMGTDGSFPACVFSIPYFIFKGSLVDPLMRALSEVLLKERVPRAGGRPGYPFLPIYRAVPLSPTSHILCCEGLLSSLLGQAFRQNIFTSH